jgi:hypothetical protein
MRNAKLEKCIKDIKKLNCFYKEYNKKFNKRYPFYRPSEQEVVAYQILPLLFSLGLSKEQIAVQYPTNYSNAKNHADIIVYEEKFNEGLRGNEAKDSVKEINSKILTIIEAKNPSILDSNKEHDKEYESKRLYKEAKKYLQDDMLCKSIIVTDGLRYYAYDPKNDKQIAKIDPKRDKLEYGEICTFFREVGLKP